MLVLETYEQKPPLLVLFANAQLASVADKKPSKNLLLEVAVSAFFYGASHILDKESANEQVETRSVLVGILISCCEIPKSSAIGIVDTMDALSKKNALVEYFMQQGSEAVEQWLACDTTGDDMLARLVGKYRGRTLREFGIEGVGTRYEAQQKLLYLRLDDSVERIHRRSKILLFVITTLVIILITSTLWGIYFR